ncbi:MAG TPA: hypothetical protein DEP45_07715 [Armatimonadetes bacterium]|nr:hypothetical protein [Armatimonadota bacterium]
MAATENLDVIVLGSAMVEITPAKMGQALADVDTMVPLPSGAAANFAAVLASLGVRTALISRVGEDELGQWLTERLAQRGIVTDYVAPAPGQRTPVSFAWMDRQGAKTFYFYRFPGFSDPMATLRPGEITPDQLQGARIFDFTEATVRNEPLRSAAFDVARLAREAGLQVCYALNYRPSAWHDQTPEQIACVQREACSRADIVLMNREEALHVTGCSVPAQAAREVSGLGPRLVVITAGDEGSLLLADGELEQIPAHPVEVVYDIGAGDAFHAGLLAALLTGMSPAQAARFASEAAALRISRGVTEANPSYDEVARLMQQ